MVRIVVVNVTRLKVHIQADKMEEENIPMKGEICPDDEFEFPGFVLFFGLVLFLIAVTMAVYQSHNEKKLQDKHEY